jgi:ERCC4-related helicase
MISVNIAKELVDFSAGVADRKNLAEQQIRGSVALYNIFQNQNLAYLADEVGMGKTYVALGTIALMRKKKPDLRVLYLLPKNNVRDKWVKDYRSFVEHNYRHDDLIVRSLERTPAAPSVVCKGLEALIREAASGNNQDIFICSSALSFMLGNDTPSLINSLTKLKQLYPGDPFEINDLLAKFDNKDIENKEFNGYKADCKRLWAQAINRILPNFDLIVVDEAHNFKRGLESSDRNKNLGVVLGTSVSNNFECDIFSRINKVLLLSATPYEYHLNELENQLVLFGSSLLSDDLEKQDKDDTRRKERLSEFMVRRLNVIYIEEKPHTRNMYRDEHRTGLEAQVQMNDGQKLFSALLQKRISDHLRVNHAGKYQTGLLASFESYMPGRLENTEHAAFDGDEDNRSEDARDEGVVGQLIKRFQQSFDKMPPHPKMDWVAEQLHEKMYQQGKKQLIFVRRVASVSELKKKFEELYDKEFIGEFIAKDKFVKRMYDYYLANKYQGKLATADVIDEKESTGKEEGKGEVASDDFFTWFYRGRNQYVENKIGGDVTPHNFRQKISQRSTMFELNWANWLRRETGIKVDNIALSLYAEPLELNPNDTDDQKRFVVAQYCYLKCLKADISLSENLHALVSKLLKYLYPEPSKLPKISLNDRTKLIDALDEVTFFDLICQNDKLKAIFPFWHDEHLKKDILTENDKLSLDRAIHFREILRSILAYICRVDHPWIDLYSVRAVASGKELTAFISLLEKQQLASDAFSSFTILTSITENADLLIKLNFSEAYRQEHPALMRYISNQIQRLQSCAGASGINSGDRSPLARRFRMPGYPMLLISTDVFQEGEDLHTFCDSVNHYGISASPIALEQKVGRVDRIGSMSQRAIAIKQQSAQDHFIQVRYPHIKESVEYIQVQNSALNLNRFIRNLHKVGNVDDAPIIESHIDSKLMDIEPQIRTKLSSPFEATKYIEVTNKFDENLISCQKDKLASLIKRIEQNYLDNNTFEMTTKGLCFDSNGFMYSLRSARKTNELVFSVTTRHPDLMEISEDDDLLLYLQQSAKKFIGRLQSTDIKEPFFLNVNVERLFCLEEQQVAGNLSIIQDEMNTNVRSFSDRNMKLNLGKAISEFHQLHELIRIKTTPNTVGFSFICSKRNQLVKITQDEQYYCFNSPAISASKLSERFTENGNNEVLLKYTVGRNIDYDLVDFYIDECKGISVRAFCRKDECTDQYLLRVMHRVAREADRLEYLFSDEDLF